MDEIFNDWVLADDAARVEAHGKKDQGTTIMLTWTPVITRWHALAMFLFGARAGRLNVASIKVLSARGGEARLLIKQQSEKDTTDKELGDAIDRGRTTGLEAGWDNADYSVVPCGQSVAPDGWWCQRRKGHDGPCAAMPLAEAVATRRAPLEVLKVGDFCTREQADLIVEELRRRSHATWCPTRQTGIEQDCRCPNDLGKLSKEAALEVGLDPDLMS